MAPAAADGKSACWWVHVVPVRKVVACAVVLLIIAVSVYAVFVVLRHGELTVSVVEASSSLSPTTSNRHVQELEFVIELDNLGGRGTMYYTGVTAQLVGRNTSAAAAANSIMNFTLHDIIVEQQRTLSIPVRNSTSTSYGEMFVKNQRKISPSAEADLILHGNLTTNLYLLRNRTSTPITYTCYNVTVGDSSDDIVPCLLKSAAAAQLCYCSAVFLVISLLLLTTS